MEWSPCASFWIINIDTEILLTASNNAAGEISVDPIDGTIDFVVGTQ
jgi:fructose-1,6-bisphosphatase/inositol monophosphatase family enzyme